jgi:hypothetical protein
MVLCDNGVTTVIPVVPGVPHVCVWAITADDMKVDASNP